MKTIPIEETIKLVTELHKGQIYGKSLPYVVHLMSVARHFDDLFYKTVALLHDTLEDTEISFDILLGLYGNAVAETVLVLTKKENDLYLQDYIARIAKDPVARKVKIADLTENIYYSEHYGKIDGIDSRLKRYEKALKILVDCEINSDPKAWTCDW